MIKIPIAMLKRIFGKFKSEHKILLLAGLISISVGLWENFQQLWLENYGFSVETIANVLSAATFICAAVCLFVAWRVKPDKIKSFVALCLILQICALIGLGLMSDMPNMAPLVKLLAVIDTIGQKIIFLSTWPLMSACRKDDDTYGKIGLTEYVFRDLGVLVGGLFIGRTIGGFVVGYNMFLGLALVFYTMALLSLVWIKLPKIRNCENGRLAIVLRHIRRDRILSMYFLYYFINRIAYCCALGLKMLIFTNVLSFSASAAVNFFLIVGILADLIGVICLRWLTPRSDYVTMSIKFGGRFIMYSLAFLTGNPIVMLSAMTFAVLLSKSFDNRTEAPYINRIGCQGQFSLVATRKMVRSVGESIGMSIAGAAYAFGLRYILGAAAVFVLIQTIIGYILIYMRTHESKVHKNI